MVSDLNDWQKQAVRSALSKTWRLGLGGASTSIEDMSQDAAEAVLRAKLRPDVSEAEGVSYLRQRALGGVLDAHRVNHRQGAGKSRRGEAPGRDHDYDLEGLLSDSEDPFQCLVVQRAIAAVCKLRPPIPEALDLWVEGYTLDEIGERYGVEGTAVWFWMDLVRDVLVKHLRLPRSSLLASPGGR